MARPLGQACSGCRYFILEATPEMHTGECHAHPPETGGNAGVTAWPTVEADDWCGEWKPTTE